MATAPAPARTSPTAKYDAQVAGQLSRAERRVRLLDLAAGLCVFVALSLGYAAIMVLLHWKLQLSPPIRQVALVVYLLGAAAFLTWKVILPYRRPINPRFAALQLERTLPGSKNSVLNYVDLRDEDLPAAIRGALGRRAAKDAVHANVDEAISARDAGRAGGLAAAFAVLMLVLMFTVGFGDFFRLLGGVLAPSTPPPAVDPGPRNRITVRLPAEGNATVVAGSALDFAVRVDGDLPADEAQLPKLVLTYPQSKDAVVRPMTRPRTAGGDWIAALSALEVRDGFDYHVTAGDAETPEYRVSVVFTPAITKFVAVYHYRSYLGEPSLRVQVDNRRLQASRGTTVDLRVQTNGGVEKATIEMTGKDGRLPNVEAVVAQDDAEAFEARFTLEETGTYRVCFTPTRGEKYRDPLAYEIIANPDKPPHNVKLTKPGFDIRLPANGLLKVEGSADDDIGVKSLTLRMKIKDGPVLKDRPYRSDAELRLPTGGYLTTLAYKDAVDLKAVQGEDGKPMVLKEGIELEYWLEARDACDYPVPNPAVESKHYFVKLTAPEQNPQKEKKDRDDAAKEQKDHQAKQDEQRQQENEKRQEQQKQAEDQQKNEQNGKNDESRKNPDDSQKNDGKDGADQQNKLDGDQQDDVNKLNKDREENERRGQESGANGDTEQPPKPDAKPDPKGSGKDAQPNPADSKPADPKQGDNRQGQGQNDKSEAKPEGKEGENKDGGKGKDSNKPGDQQAEGKNGGKDGSMDGSKADAKGGSPSGAEGMGSEKPGEAKNDTAKKPSPPNSGAGEGKGGDPKGADGQAAKGKAGDHADNQTQGKEAGSDGKVADGKPAGDGKEEKQPGKAGPPDATAKDGGQQGMGEEMSGTAKGDGGNGNPDAKADMKSAPGQGPDQKTATAKGEGDKNNGAGGDVSRIDAKDPSVKDLRNLIEALKKGDEKQIGKALEKLDEIANKSENPNSRDFANNLMKDLKKHAEEEKQREQNLAGKERGPATPHDEAKPEERPSTQKGAPAKDDRDGPAKAKDEKGDPTAKNGSDKGPGRKDQPLDPMAPPKGKGDKDDPTQARVKGPKNPFGRNDDRADASNSEDLLKPGKRANPLNQPNTTLQLSPFDKSKYQDQEDRLVDKSRQPRNDTTPTTGATGKPADLSKGTLNNLTGRKTDRNTASTDPVDAGRAAPPPGYGKALTEYSKKAAQPDADKP
jgi:hypothetical protein